MDQSSPRVFETRNAFTDSVGDPFVGVPVDRNIVNEVAFEFDLETRRLAQALGKVERSPDAPSVETLYAGFDPLPMGTDKNGHLYVIAEAESCWATVADELSLTTVGKKAVATAHDRHVKRHANLTQESSGLGVIVSCPEFPAAVVDDIRMVTETTTLTARQATIWMLDQHSLDCRGIADILGLPEAVIESKLVEIDSETRRVTTAATVLDVPHTTLTRTIPEPTDHRWMGIDWSPWLTLSDREELLSTLPTDSGVYRVRHTDLDGLLYIGETGSDGGLRDRVGHGLAVGLDRSEPPDGGNHDATAPLWELKNTVDGQLEVSVGTPPEVANERYRLATEATLVAVARREMGRTPDVMLRRKPSTEGGEPSDGTNDGNYSLPGDRSYQVPSWRHWRATTSGDWLGYDWTNPHSLADRSEVEISDGAAFRVWNRDAKSQEWGQLLALVGTTDAVESRLFTLEREYGPEKTFSVVDLPNLSEDDVARSREFEEVRYDLVGAQYLATGHPPRDQF
jgi:hypothetical protein